MIYIFDRIDMVSMKFFTRMLPLLPPERREKALRYKHAVDRTLCVAAYGLLLYGLHKEYGICEAPTFFYGRKGKPYLVEYPHIFFNFSHCEAGVACVLSSQEVGIDIEKIHYDYNDYSRLACTKDELDCLANNDRPEDLFCRFWTIKESYSKQQGGSAYPFYLLSADRLCRLAGERFVHYTGNGYQICCFGDSISVELCDLGSLSERIDDFQISCHGDVGCRV